jgi:RimJ/RimL family protein N-acetyltransferase
MAPADMADDGPAPLADGRMITVRPAGTGDVAAIARLYLQLTAESTHRRFHSGRPPAALAEQLASLRADVVSFVAVPDGDADGGYLVAEARYVPVDAETAELALTVRDGYQGAGLGRRMLGALVQRARQDGLKRLRADVLLGNTPMLRLLLRCGCALTAPVEDYHVACLEISVTGGMPGWPADGTARRVLVERRGWFDDGQAAAHRSAGDEVRQCPGPLRKAGRDCPLVTSGHCQLAEDADLIINLLPGDDPDCAAVLAAHQRRWPRLLAPG